MRGSTVKRLRKLLLTRIEKISTTKRKMAFRSLKKALQGMSHKDRFTLIRST